MTQPTRLKPDEPVRLEQTQIAALYASVGEAQAEEIICRAMEELAMRLALMEKAHATWDGKTDPVRGMDRLAELAG